MSLEISIADSMNKDILPTVWSVMATYLVNILLHDKINSNCPVLCEVIQTAKGVNYLSHTQVFK